MNKTKFINPKVSKGLVSKIADYHHDAETMIRLRTDWCNNGAMDAINACKMTMTNDANTQKEIVGAFLVSGVSHDSIVKDTIFKRTGRGKFFESRFHVIKLRNYSLRITTEGDEKNDDKIPQVLMKVDGSSNKALDVTYCQPMEVARLAFAIDNAIVLWQTEVWAKAVLKGTKMAKMRAVSETGIEMMLRTKCYDAGLRFAMEKQKIRVKVYFDIGHNSMVEMVLSHKHFIEQIDNVIATVMALKRMTDEVGQAIKIKRTSRYNNWIGDE